MVASGFRGNGPRGAARARARATAALAAAALLASPAPASLPPAHASTATSAHASTPTSAQSSTLPTAADGPIGAACPTAVMAAGGFVDVATTSAHAAAITCLQGWDVVRGGSDGTFRPGADATRAHIAIILHGLLERAGRAPADAESLAFTDVGETSAGREAIAALNAAGVIRGTTATTFSPHAPIDRGQMASLLVRASTEVFGTTLPEGHAFPDTVGTTHAASIRQLVGAGVTVGYADGTYRPHTSMSRAQMATFLTRYLDMLVREGVATASAPDPESLTHRRAADPARTIVEDADGAHVATFTDGARTVALTGPGRTFREQDVTATVTSTTWVRLLPRPFDGLVDRAWLDRTRQDRTPDVLATSLQYVAGSPTVYGPDGLLLAADAAYGPLRSDGSRPIGSDWHDFQGIAATYPTGSRPARAERYGSVDCSGYIRLLFGVRFGMGMSRPPDGGRSLPRVSRDQAAEAPGIVPEAGRDRQITDFRRLQPGDLVFFDASSARSGIDHVGMYLGEDDAGRHRFVSSRRSINGPTMGDHRGASLLDGTGLYARSFRSTRRL